MRKPLFSILWMAFAISILVSGCQKDTVTLKARFEKFSNDSKLHFDPTNRTSTWDEGDQVYVNGYWYELSANSTIEVRTSTQYVAYFVTPGTVVTSDNGAPTTFSIPQEQEFIPYGTDGQKIVAPMYANSTNTTLVFKNMGAVLAIKLKNISDYSNLTISWIDVTATNNLLWGTATIDESDPTAPSYHCEPDANVTNQNKIRLSFANNPITLAQNQERIVYVSVPPVAQNVENRYSILVHAYQLGNVLEYHREQPATALYAGSIHRNQWANVPFDLVSDADVEDIISSASLPLGILDYSSKFSVSDSRQVYFSQGNLQYDLGGNTWHFANSQTDAIGADNIDNLAHSTGRIDLFGWGTSGWNSGANAYQPYSTSTINGDYYVGGSESNNLTGNFVQADWGYNDIVNGRLSGDNDGSQTPRGTWRTLTKIEYEYLLTSRLVDGIEGHSGRNYDYDAVSYNGKVGLLIYPDANSDVTATPAQGTLGSPQRQVHAHFDNSSTNTTVYDIDAIPNGCVFLLGVKQRNGTVLSDSKLTYWTASRNIRNAYSLSFTNSYVPTLGGSGRYLGMSVRLVCNVQ